MLRMYLQFLSQPLDGISHSSRSIFLSSGYYIKVFPWEILLGDTSHAIGHGILPMVEPYFPAPGGTHDGSLVPQYTQNRRGRWSDLDAPPLLFCKTSSTALDRLLSMSATRIMMISSTILHPNSKRKGPCRQPPSFCYAYDSGSITAFSR